MADGYTLIVERRPTREETLALMAQSRPFNEILKRCLYPDRFGPGVWGERDDDHPRGKEAAADATTE